MCNWTERAVRFDHPELEREVGRLHGLGEEPRTWWQNYRFEERAAAGRRRRYEAAFGDDVTAEELQGLHADYIYNHVNLPVASRIEPHPFQDGNDDAHLAPPDGGEVLVRVEDLSGWCDSLFPSGDYDALAKAWADRDAAFESFLGRINAQRGPWPMFAALAGDLDGTVKDWRGRWSSLLPALLGLGHLDLEHPGGKRVLALMCYRVQRVLDAPGAAPAAHRFAAPTTLDHKLNACFMPSPFPQPGKGVSYGRAVNLDGGGTLVCEMIHRHIRYQLDDVRDVQVIQVPMDRMAVAEARTLHLERLRAAAAAPAFGTAAEP